MTISWYGEACFLLENGGVRILIEPPQKESGINPPRLKTDILIYSRPRDDKPEESGAFEIDGPGEYEVKGVNIVGVSDGFDKLTTGGENTLYYIEMDEIKIAHLGFLKEEPSAEKLAILDDPDILLIPVGNNDVLDAEKAMKLINKIEPSIAIPMLYDFKGLKTKRAPISGFLKESEAKESAQPKLVIKKKDLIEEETKIVILEKV
jgi:L-ascorbate metabolism protein UlaG (beta-lactamase superfamily)